MWQTFDCIICYFSVIMMDVSKVRALLLEDFSVLKQVDRKRIGCSQAYTVAPY